jgi:hypothetical protein
VVARAPSARSSIRVHDPELDSDLSCSATSRQVAANRAPPAAKRKKKICPAVATGRISLGRAPTRGDRLSRLSDAALTASERLSSEGLVAPPREDGPALGRTNAPIGIKQAAVAIRIAGPGWRIVVPAAARDHRGAGINGRVIARCYRRASTSRRSGNSRNSWRRDRTLNSDVRRIGRRLSNARPSAQFHLPRNGHVDWLARLHRRHNANDIL